MTDNGGLSVSESITLVVNDVALTFTTTIAIGSLNAGSITATSLIEFSDPTFSVPALGYVPSFAYSINWGDGTPIQTGTAPVTQFGSVGNATQGAVLLSHVYAVAGTYHPTITVIDPQNGEVLGPQNVLQNGLSTQAVSTLTVGQFTELDVQSMTMSSGQAFNPNTLPLNVTIDWGDNSTTVQPIPGPLSCARHTEHNFSHVYTGPPDPMNPAAMIPVSITISEVPGASVTAHFLVQVPGTGVAIVTFLPEPTPPPVPPPQTVVTEGSSFLMSASPPPIATPDSIPSRAETVGAVEDQIVMRMVFPTGKEGENVLLPPHVLDNLPGYLKRLPDGHYRIYFVQGDTRRERMIIDVNVRQGRPVDAGDDSEGTQDRPPSAQFEVPRGIDSRPAILVDLPSESTAAWMRQADIGKLAAGRPPGRRASRLGLDRSSGKRRN